MTLADQLRKEGIEKGIEEGKKEIILSLLKNGMKEKAVAEKTGIDLERILKIENKMRD